LNYKKGDGFIAMDFSENEIPRKILIPIVGVVKELPSLTDFLCTQHFYNQRIVNIEYGNAFSAENIRSVSFITRDGMKTAEKFRHQLDQLIARLKQKKDLENIDLNVSRPVENNISYIPYTQVDITIYNDTSLRLRDKIYNAVMSDPEIDVDKFQRYYDFYPNLTKDYNIQLKCDRISIEFPNKDKIRDFKTFLFKTYDLSIELGQIEAMENYNFVTKLTRIISIILMVFSIVSISLFVSNLMQNHLEKIKMNIGTFLAFGIDSKSLERVYLSLIYLVILGALSIGLLVSWAIGQAGLIRLVLSLLGEKLEEHQNYFEQFSPWTLVLILFVLFTSYFSIIRITGKIFRNTPGDLLYERV
jgi:ABC-type antimicrobial peptide transport system permease subunit